MNGGSAFKRPTRVLEEDPDPSSIQVKRRRPEESLEQRPASLKLDGNEKAEEDHENENAKDWIEGSEVGEEQECGEEDGEELGGEQGADPASIVEIEFHDYSSKMQMRFQETEKTWKQVCFCLIAPLFLTIALVSSPVII
jgi:hypothetical protein